MDEVRVAIIDDHAIVRQGLRAMIDREPDLRVVGEAPSATTAMAMLDRARPGHLASDDLPERLRLAAPVVRDTERDEPEAIVQPDDRAACPSVQGGVEHALPGHLEQRPPDRPRQRHRRAGDLHAHVELTASMLGREPP